MSDENLLCRRRLSDKGALTLTHEKIRGVFTEVLTQDDYEIVFVDDGSPMGPWMRYWRCIRPIRKVRVVTFTRNFGQMAAILAGMHEASGDALINISADLQDPVMLIRKWWKNGREGTRS